MQSGFFFKKKSPSRIYGSPSLLWFRSRSTLHDEKCGTSRGLLLLFHGLNCPAMSAFGYARNEGPGLVFDFGLFHTGASRASPQKMIEPGDISDSRTRAIKIVYVNLHKVMMIT